MTASKWIISILVLISWTCKDVSAVFYRNDYTYVPETQTFYKFQNRTATWSDAWATCLSEGANLVVPSSQTEYDAIVRLQSQYPGSFLWLGLTDLYSSRNFITVDGKPPTYTNWLAGEPNNPNERCLMLYVNNQYNDAPCSILLRFMCSIPLNKMIIYDNPRCMTNDLDYFYSFRTDRCYKVYGNTARRTWSDAYKTCASEGSSLAVINSRDEAKIVSRALGTFPTTPDFEQAFIGSNDLLLPGEYVTLDGIRQRDSGFNDWYTPAPASPDYRCGTLRRSEVLSKYDCNLPLDFVCEKKLARDSCPIL